MGFVLFALTWALLAPLILFVLILRLIWRLPFEPWQRVVLMVAFVVLITNW